MTKYSDLVKKEVFFSFTKQTRAKWFGAWGVTLPCLQQLAPLVMVASPVPVTSQPTRKENVKRTHVLSLWGHDPEVAHIFLPISLCQGLVTWPNNKKATKCSFQLQFSSVAHARLTLCHHMDCSMPGLPVHHQLPKFTQTCVHWVSDAIQPSHTLSSPSPAFNLSQH